MVLYHHTIKGEFKTFYTFLWPATSQSVGHMITCILAARALYLELSSLVITVCDHQQKLRQQYQIWLIISYVWIGFDGKYLISALNPMISAQMWLPLYRRQGKQRFLKEVGANRLHKGSTCWDSAFKWCASIATRCVTEHWEFVEVSSISRCDICET